MKIRELLLEHRLERVFQADKLRFSGLSDRDVYNISAPFDFDGKLVLLGRVESRESEHSESYIFEQTGLGFWQQVPDSIILPLQDPFIFKIAGQQYLGGVEVTSDEAETSWRTVIYWLSNLTKAERIFEGPWGMKDLRLKELSDGRILVLTRPRGKKGGRGKIGVLTVDSLSDLTIEMIEAAPLLNGQFSDDEWGGANEIHEINGRIYFLGHIANFDKDENRHYYAATYELSSDFTEIVEGKIIAERRDFLPGESKRADLQDVVFSGGLILQGEFAELYAGTSDAEAQKLTIRNPFLKNESEL